MGKKFVPPVLKPILKRLFMGGLGGFLVVHGGFSINFILAKLSLAPDIKYSLATPLGLAASAIGAFLGLIIALIDRAKAKGKDK